MCPRRPSVVHIACVGAGGGGPPALLDPKAVPRNFGSGFVWDREGHVVTNYHVIHAATAARVTLANNRKCEAVLRGAEPDKDLAGVCVCVCARSLDHCQPWGGAGVGDGS